jgi:amino acid adenylation domain-containing protein
MRLGGDSLRAMRLAAEAECTLGVALEVSALLSDRPLGDVLAAAGPPDAARTVAAPVGAPPADDHDSPSATQRGMWLREQLLGASPYNLIFTCRIDGPLRRDLLLAAIRQTVARHEGLRTVFSGRRGMVQRRVLTSFQPVVDQRSYPDVSGFAEYVTAAAAEFGGRPFDLEGAPPLRFLLISGAPGRHALILSAHHILLDGWAIGLVLTEIFGHYEAMEQGRSLELVPGRQFAEYLDWQERLQATGILDRDAAFWRRELAGVPAVMQLPADRPAPALPDPAGARWPLDFGSGLGERIRTRATQLGITRAAFFLGAFALTLSRYTAAERMLIGLPVAGRPTPELAELVSVTTNLVPVLVSIDDDRPASSYLRGVQQSLGRSLDHAALPFERIVAEAGTSGSLSRHPLVQVALGVHDGLIPQHLQAGTLSISVAEGHGGGAQFDVELFIRQATPSLAGDLEYATAVWQPAEASAFAEDLRQALSELATAGERKLYEARCIAPARRDLLDRLNDTDRAYPPLTIDEMFRQQTARTPHAVAVRAADATLTYSELARLAARQATLLTAAGVTGGSSVLVSFERSAAEVVGLLGVLWAGAVYVPVEPGTPEARVRQMISVLRPAAVLAPGGLRGTGTVPPVGSYEESWTGRPADRAGLPEPNPQRLAYVAFTSGSTGVPKGVGVPHRAVIRLACGLSEYAPLGPSDRMLRFAPLSFDAATLELWGALLNGASLAVHPPGLPSPAALGGYIRSAGVTVAWLTAGLFRLVSEFAAGDLSGMRVLLTGGDVVSPESAARLLRQHPALTIVNGYGPTENTTFTTVHRLTGPEEVEDSLPIGRPVANTKVYLLDRRHRLVPPGAVGELYTSGDGLASGYYADPSQTARSFGMFSPDVPSRLYRTGDLARLDTRGRLQFLGRLDDQVKIRGFRVEPGEVRAALLAHPGVSDAFVTVTAEKELLAGCACAIPGLSATEVSGFLGTRLPGYMIPGLWAMLPELPLTPNGKVDREALRTIARPAAAASPANPKSGAWDLIGAAYWNSGYDGGPAGADCDQYLHGLRAGEPVLLVGASTLRLASAAVELGLELTVADFSRTMLDELQSVLGGAARYQHADVTSIDTALRGEFRAVLGDRLLNRFTLAEMHRAVAQLAAVLAPGGELRLSYRLGLYERDHPILAEARRRGVLAEVFDEEAYDIDYAPARSWLPEVLSPHGGIPMPVLVGFYTQRGREHRLRPGELDEIVAQIAQAQARRLGTAHVPMSSTAHDYLLQVTRQPEPAPAPLKPDGQEGPCAGTPDGSGG